MIYALTDKYFVRALEERDLEGPYPTWFQDQEVCKYNSHGKFPKNADYFRAFYAALNGEDEVVWALCHATDGHIGNLSLQAISLIDRNAEFAVILGDKRHWGKGIGFAAAGQLLRHGFEKLNLTRVYCGTAATNEPMRNLALRLGMMQEGVRRKHMYLEGQWVDMVEYGVLKDEFRFKRQAAE
jgi:ribosomal-protein-alanine N-acetyltransferase